MSEDINYIMEILHKMDKPDLCYLLGKIKRYIEKERKYYIVITKWYNDNIKNYCKVYNIVNAFNINEAIGLIVRLFKEEVTNYFEIEECEIDKYKNNERYRYFKN